ncbi:MAG: hypothetical protein FWC89_09280 [Defluviitaleaceae bacterium]|nr:hypothetical protein [Defluviitaleaceae bacterium]
MEQPYMKLRVAQKDKLYTLYRLKKRNEGNVVIGLEDDINETEAKMRPEDVALVKEKINELDKK